MSEHATAIRTLTLQEVVGWVFGIFFGIMAGMIFASGIMASILKADFLVFCVSLGATVCYAAAMMLTMPPFFHSIEEHFSVKLSGPLRFVGVFCFIFLAIIFGYVMVIMSGAL